MICKHCEGTGGFVYDDYEPVACLECDGKGRVFRFAYLWWRAEFLLKEQAERVRFSRPGGWYWRRWGKERRARRTARGRTVFQLQALHGDRLCRLRTFATAVEDGTNVQRNLRIEQRLVDEAERAVEIAVFSAAREKREAFYSSGGEA